MRDPRSRVPEDYLREQMEYVNGSKNVLQRFFRSIVAAWKCSKVARAHQKKERAILSLRKADLEYKRAIRAR